MPKKVPIGIFESKCSGIEMGKRTRSLLKFPHNANANVLAMPVDTFWFGATPSAIYQHQYGLAWGQPDTATGWYSRT